MTTAIILSDYSCLWHWKNLMAAVGAQLKQRLVVKQRIGSQSVVSFLEKIKIKVGLQLISKCHHYATCLIRTHDSLPSKTYRIYCVSSSSPPSSQKGESVSVSHDAYYLYRVHQWLLRKEKWTLAMAHQSVPVSSQINVSRTRRKSSL